MAIRRSLGWKATARTESKCPLNVILVFHSFGVSFCCWLCSHIASQGQSLSKDFFFFLLTLVVAASRVERSISWGSGDAGLVSIRSKSVPDIQILCCYLLLIPLFTFFSIFCTFSFDRLYFSCIFLDYWSGQCQCVFLWLPYAPTYQCIMIALRMRIDGVRCVGCICEHCHFIHIVDRWKRRVILRVAMCFIWLCCRCCVSGTCRWLRWREGRFTWCSWCGSWSSCYRADWLRRRGWWAVLHAGWVCKRIGEWYFAWYRGQVVNFLKTARKEREIVVRVWCRFSADRNATYVFSACRLFSRSFVSAIACGVGVVEEVSIALSGLGRW